MVLRSRTCEGEAKDARGKQQAHWVRERGKRIRLSLSCFTKKSLRVKPTRDKKKAGERGSACVRS